MNYDVDLLARHADRLVERAIQQLGKYDREPESDGHNPRTTHMTLLRARRQRLRLQRLELYRTVLRSSPHSRDAMLPEFLEASGLLPTRSQRARRTGRRLPSL